MDATAVTETPGQRNARVAYEEIREKLEGHKDYKVEDPSNALTNLKFEPNGITPAQYKLARKHLKLLRQRSEKDKRIAAAAAAVIRKPATPNKKDLQVTLAVKKGVAPPLPKHQEPTTGSVEEKGTGAKEAKEPDPESIAKTPKAKAAPAKAKKKKKKKKKSKKQGAQHVTKPATTAVAVDDEIAYLDALLKKQKDEGAAAAAAAPPPPIWVAATKPFQLAVFKASKVQEGFNDQHREIVNLLYMSNLPMFPEFLRTFNIGIYHLLIRFQKGQRLTSQLVHKILFTKEQFLDTEYDDVCDFITAQQSTFALPTCATSPTMQSSTLTKFMGALVPIFKLCLSEVGSNSLILVVSKKEAAEKRHLLWWESAYRKAIDDYYKRVKKAVTSFEKRVTTRTVENLHAESCQLDVISSFQLLVDLCSTDPFLENNFEVKMTLLREDLADGALFDNLLDDVVLPLMSECTDTKAFSSTWMKTIALSMDRSNPHVKAILNLIKDYHLLLLERRASEKLGYNKNKIKASLKESYEHGIITPWSRILLLNAVIASLTNASLTACAGDPVKIKAYLKGQLTNIADAMQKSFDVRQPGEAVICQPLTPVLIDGHEVLTRTKISSQYKACMGKVVQFYDKLSKQSIQDPRRILMYFAYHLQDIVKIRDAMKEASIKKNQMVI